MIKLIQGCVPIGKNISTLVSICSSKKLCTFSLSDKRRLVTSLRSTCENVNRNLLLEQNIKTMATNSSESNLSKSKDVGEKAENDPIAKPSKKHRNRHNRKKGDKSHVDENLSQQSNSPHAASKQGQKHHHKKNRVNVNADESSNQLPDYLLSAHPHEKRDHGKNSHKSHNQHETEDVDKDSHAKRRSKLPEVIFQPYLLFEECAEGLKRKELLKGTLRINAKNFNDAFITDEDGGRDIYLEGVAARNRALPGDIVAVKLLPKAEWKVRGQKANESSETISELNEADLVKVGKVVFIIDQKHSRVTAGHLNPYRNNAFGFALMSPIDNRLPRLMIPLTDCPKDFKVRPKDFEKTLFIARISNWNLNMAFASGKLMRSLGEAGHIEPETEALLISNDIDSSPFSQDVIDCLPDGKTWNISSEELAKRKDLRNECIFSIDPATARDLDDALSCKKIGDDLFEVGVHIADVSHFIEQGSALDEEAVKRATSVYLAQRVIPMLPSVLCEKLCSLNPGVERLSYSVIWNIRSDGTVLKEWFGRSVIRSCAKLSYNHAQEMIDITGDNPLIPDKFPEIYGQFTLEKIRDTVKDLHGISAHLRKRRFESGALKLDQPKLAFALDDKTGLPNGCSVYEYKDSNRMIEEFMLLANMAVGRKIFADHPDRAILRRHPPPHPTMMEDVLNLCKQHDIPFDVSDSASISRSLDGLSELEPELQETLVPALVLMCTKPFQNAQYFCTGHIEDETIYSHYALNVPIYTHFTSPIRRYPDVLVHRFLTASLDANFEVDRDVKELQSIAEHCNDKKWAAKKVSEQSSLLFFAVYLMECGPLSEKGVVVGVLNRAVDVLCTRLGIVTRIYCERLPLFKFTFEMVNLKQELTLYWQDDSMKTVEEKIAALTEKFEKNWQKRRGENESKIDNDEAIPDNVIEQKLTMFSHVDVVLSVDRKAPTKLVGTLKSPFAVDTLELGI